MTDTKQILKDIQNSDHQKIKLAVVDIDGILRGKIVRKDKFLSAAESGFGYCDVVFGWDSTDVAYDNTKFTGWHTGYPDAEARIDLSTLRHVPWDNDIPFFLADFRNPEGGPLHVCPRSLLKTVRDKAKNMGFKAVFSQEFEWFNFAEDPDTLHEKQFNNLSPLTSGMFGYSVLRASQEKEFFNDIFDLLEKFNVPIEGLHTETGPGVYEAAILYSEVLEAADRATLFKSSVKEIGHMHGIMPTFMAKWKAELPGCSGHVHQSLWDEDGNQNLFHDGSAEKGMSQLMRSYLAGQIHCLPHILPMVAPTINSYKRLVEGAWAPTTLTWAADNRTVAFRALPGGEQSCRLETRVVGSDTNPYLAMSACLAAGLYGIEKGLELNTPETIGNGYADPGAGKIPSNLWESTQAMKNSDVAKELFGEGFVDHFVSTREWEWREYSKAVTDWEVKRYFEII
ncbi:MAG: glutamine synthetase [Flavobacteriales bacterium]|jgi:glutamine synthetase